MDEEDEDIHPPEKPRPDINTQNIKNRVKNICQREKELQEKLKCLQDNACDSKGARACSGPKKQKPCGTPKKGCDSLKVVDDDNQAEVDTISSSVGEAAMPEQLSGDDDSMLLDDDAIDRIKRKNKRKTLRACPVTRKNTVRGSVAIEGSRRSSAASDRSARRKAASISAKPARSKDEDEEEEISSIAESATAERDSFNDCGSMMLDSDMYQWIADRKRNDTVRKPGLKEKPAPQRPDLPGCKMKCDKGGCKKKPKSGGKEIVKRSKGQHEEQWQEYVLSCLQTLMETMYKQEQPMQNIQNALTDVC